VFTKKVENGDFPESIEQFMIEYMNEANLDNFK
jgi:hypothetical protein